MPTLTLDRETIETADTREMADRVRALDLGRYGHVWLRLGGDDDPSMSAMIHAGERGLLMFSRCAGDPGFSSRNPDYDGDQRAALTFILSNGQEDEYPASWTYPLEVLRAAFLELLETGARPTMVRWYDDDRWMMVDDG